MIHNVKPGDFIKLPKKMKFNHVYYDIIGIQNNYVVLADSDRYLVNGIPVLDFIKEEQET